MQYEIYILTEAHMQMSYLRSQNICFLPFGITGQELFYDVLKFCLHQAAHRL